MTMQATSAKSARARPERHAEPDDRLAELLDRWERLRDVDREVDPAEVCEDAPELQAAFVERVAALEATRWLDEPILDDTTLFDESAAAYATGAAPLPEQLGRYELVEVIGVGGFGEVWKAYDTELQRTVAVKVTRPDRLLFEDRSDDFLAEARRVAKLRHHVIVPIFDFGQTFEHRYIVSQYIPGGDLARRMQARRYTTQEAVRLIIRICEGLHHAHETGIIHRDIKPANILLDEDGAPYLTDFGIAATQEQLQAEESGGGTLRYMSPEQFNGEVRRIDRRSDIFSLGVVFTELLTGERPFNAQTVMALREQILHEPPALAELKRPIDPELEPIVQRCLAKNPAERYATAQDLARDLKEFLGRAYRGSWWIRWSVMVVSAVLMSLTILAALGWYYQSVEQAEVLARIGSMEVQNRAALLTLNHGGSLRIEGGPTIFGEDDLPDEAFAVTEVSLPESWSIGDKDLSFLVQAPTLQKLDLSQTKITDAGLQEIARASSLRVLKISDTAITNDGLAALKSLENLEALEIHRTQVDARGLQHVIALPRLRRLMISGPDFDDDSIQALASMERLSQLRLIDTHVTEAGIARLKQRLPDCDVRTNP